MRLGNATTSEEEPRREVTTIIKLDEPAPALAPGDSGIWDLPDFERREGLRGLGERTLSRNPNPSNARPLRLPR
jgi:hypothetical protein